MSTRVPGATDADGRVSAWVEDGHWWWAVHEDGADEVVGTDVPAPGVIGVCAAAGGARFLAWTATDLRLVAVGGDTPGPDDVDLGRPVVVPGRPRSVAVLGTGRRERCCVVLTDGQVLAGEVAGDGAGAWEVVGRGATGVSPSRRRRAFVLDGPEVALVPLVRRDDGDDVLGVPRPVAGAGAEGSAPIAYDEVLDLLWRADPDGTLVGTTLRDDVGRVLYRLRVAPGATSLVSSRGGEWLLVSRREGGDSLVNVASQAEFGLPHELEGMTMRVFGYDARLCAVGRDGVLALRLPARPERRAVRIDADDDHGWTGRMRKTSSVALRRGRTRAGAR